MEREQKKKTCGGTCGATQTVFFQISPPSPSPVFFVDLVAETDRVDDGEFQLDVALLQVVRARPQVNAVLIMAGLFVFKHGVEERVH